MLAKNNGIPIKEFDLNNIEESTSEAHEGSQAKIAEVRTDKRSHAFGHKFTNCRHFNFSLAENDNGDR